MHHNIGAVFDRPQQDGSRDGVVDDQRNAVLVGHASQLLDIANVSRRIADTFAENSAGMVVDQLFYIAGPIRFREAYGDSLVWQNMSEQRLSGAIQHRNRDDIAAHPGEIEHCIMDRRLPGAHAQGFESSLQRGDAPLQHRCGRIADPAVAKPLDFEVEKGCPVVGTIELVGDGLIDWNRHGLGRRIDVIAAVNRDRLASHDHLSSRYAMRLIWPTTHSMSCSLVRKLVMQARRTGVLSPSRTPDIQAIWRS